MPKYEVFVNLEICTSLMIDAEDETDAAHKIIANVEFDWIDYASRDPQSVISSLSLEVCPDGESDAPRSTGDHYQVVTFSKEQVRDIESPLLDALINRHYLGGAR